MKLLDMIREALERRAALTQARAEWDVALTLAERYARKMTKLRRAGQPVPLEWQTRLDQLIEFTKGGRP